jgi:hypothetical protein
LSKVSAPKRQSTLIFSFPATACMQAINKKINLDSEHEIAMIDKSPNEIIFLLNHGGPLAHEHL